MHWIALVWPYKLNCQKVPSIVNTYPREPNFHPYPSATCRFRDTSLWKIGMHWVTSDWPWTINCQKYPVSTEYLPPEAESVIRFALQPAFFEIQGCEKSEMHWMSREWPQTLNCLKYLVYTEPSKVPCRHWIIIPNFRPKFYSLASLYDTMVKFKFPQKQSEKS